MKRTNACILLIAVLSLSAGLALAQGPPPPPPNPAAVPIDGGLGVLVAAGAALATRKIYKKHTEQ
ncbi:MAG: PID-CTERM protein-sorting domain-containing protein [Bacteroidia bacterium]